MPRIHITGASGTGTSTLARALASRLRTPWFDSDDYFWVSTVPPYTRKRDPAVRDRRLGEDLRAFEHWVWSGSAVRWKHGALDRLTLCVFLTIPPDVRMERLRQRESAMWPEQPYVDEDEVREEMAKFLAWAERYDEGDLDVRSRRLHEEWLATLPCPVLRIDGVVTTAECVERVLAAVD